MFLTLPIFLLASAPILPFLEGLLKEGPSPLFALFLFPEVLYTSSLLLRNLQSPEHA